MSELCLQSQIRTKLIAELSRDGGSKLFMGRINKKSGSTLVQKAVDSLVAHHLISSNYDYTLSIFIPESGMDQKNVRMLLKCICLLIVKI